MRKIHEEKRWTLVNVSDSTNADEQTGRLALAALNEVPEPEPPVDPI